MKNNSVNEYLKYESGCTHVHALSVHFLAITFGQAMGALLVTPHMNRSLEILQTCF